MRKTTIIPALLLILVMFAVAEHTGQREIIFPEISALALGGWILNKTPWRSSTLDFWLSPTLGALTGMLMVRFLPYAPAFMIAGAFLLVALQLKLLRSGVLPSISAAILAIITRSGSWYYPLSVCLLTGIIALGRGALDRSGTLNDPEAGSRSPIPEQAGGNWTWSELAHWSKLLAGITAVSAIAAVSGHLFMVAPPLIVAFVELSRGKALRDKSGQILGLLFFAAFSGVCWLVLIHTVWQGPLWMSAGVSTATIFLAYQLLRLPFPPAVAIALLPAIVPQGSLWSYPWQVLFGSAAFIGLAKLFFAPDERLPVVVETSAE